jgi:aminoglycoside 6'-N-acetyltransferase
MDAPVKRPTLNGTLATIRPGGRSDVEALRTILAEDSVRRWWGEPATTEALTLDLSEDGVDQLLVIEADGQVVGGIQYGEQNEPDYRSASIDIFLATAAQRRGIGAEAIRLLGRFLMAERGHHRLTIDPARENVSAIACYAGVGFRPVGVMRDYERRSDGTRHDALLMDLVAGELEDSPSVLAIRRHRARTGVADKQAIDVVTAAFYAAFRSAAGVRVELSGLYELFLPQATIVKTCGSEPTICDLPGFVVPRENLLNDGTLLDFSEHEVSERTDVFGSIAQRFSVYTSTGRRNGVAFTAYGVKSLQFVHTQHGWRIAAIAWDDERDGLVLS